MDLEPTRHGFQSFEYAAADIILAAEYSPTGQRIVLGAADHRIRVYDVEEEQSSWTMLDQWRGHDGEVLDVNCLPSHCRFSNLY